jgi:hypothetical protein
VGAGGVERLRARGGIKLAGRGAEQDAIARRVRGREKRWWPQCRRKAASNF